MRRGRLRIAADAGRCWPAGGRPDADLGTNLLDPSGDRYVVEHLAVRAEQLDPGFGPPSTARHVEGEVAAIPRERSRLGFIGPGAGVERVVGDAHNAAPDRH